jgi:hypothetical protein
MGIKWKDIWEVEPPRNEDIIFMIGNGRTYEGMLIGSEKLRKCTFLSYKDLKEYYCDEDEEMNTRVVKWNPGSDK